MSYEGFTQYLCKNGHYSVRDAYDDFDFGENEWKCKYCAEPAAWWNMVDQTNGSFDDDGKRIDNAVELEIVQEHVCVCQCGNKHFSAPTIYKTPPHGVGHHKL